jgi:putative spermidine/putrescine transport system permease protein
MKKHGSIDLTGGLVAAPAVLLLIVFFVLPIGHMFLRSVLDPDLTVEHYRMLIDSPTYLRVGWRTIYISFLSVIGCILVGTPVAYALTSEAAGRLTRIVFMVLIISFLTSSLVRAFAWMIVLGAQGPVIYFARLIALPATSMLGTSQAVLIGMVHFLLPIYILTLYAGMRNINKELVLAAEGMGASHGLALWSVYLPLAMPAISRAATLVFVTAVGFFITPALLGGPRETMLAYLISQRVDLFGDFGSAAAIGFALLIGTLVCLATANLLTRRYFRRRQG